MEKGERYVRDKHATRTTEAFNTNDYESTVICIMFYIILYYRYVFIQNIHKRIHVQIHIH